MTTTEQPVETTWESSGPVHHVIGLRPGVELIPTADGYEMHHPWGRHQLRGLSRADAEQLLQLAEHPIADSELVDHRLRTLLLSVTNLVTVGLVDRDGQQLATISPINRRAGVLDVQPVDVADAQLSRFAYLRRLPDEDALILESPLSAHRVTVHDPRIGGFVASLAGAAAVADASRRSGLPPVLAELFVAVFGAAGFLDGPDELPLWDFHDLLFHARSRYGLHDYDAGGVFAHSEQPHARAVRPPESDVTAVELPVPDWADVLAADPPLSEVLEQRRSYRTYQREPISIDRLGELLYRAARVRGVGWTGGAHPYESVDRPYPGGGGLGELELYAAVHSCRGVEPGIYRYDSAGHRLYLRNSDARMRFRLHQQGWLATGGLLTDPQIQLFVTSRLGRVQWKYSAIAYSVTLKHVGVLFQNLYLVAGAMGLSPCANGSGDTDLISRALGVDWTEEPPVGEFLLGGAPADPGSAPGAFRDVVSPVRSGRVL